MVRAGKWVSTNPEAEPHARGYWANAFLSLLPAHESYENRLHQWASEYVAAKRIGVAVLKTVVNTVFTRSWKEENTAVEKPETIWARREVYDCDPAEPEKLILPEPVRLITVGVDVQTDRLELETTGWANTLESWSIDYRILRGNLNQPTIWAELAKYLQSRFWHPWGFGCPIDGAGLDTGGHYTKQVYAFVLRKPIPNTFALKGRGLSGHSWLERSEKIRGLYLVSVDEIKRAIYDQLNITTPGPGYVHIPATRDYLWVEQLTAETCVIRTINGVKVCFSETLSSDIYHQHLFIPGYSYADFVRSGIPENTHC